MITMISFAPTDPVFISYRRSDGVAIAAELAWLLRAAGIPVWRDQDDLPPGDTEHRLQEAIDEGVSGAVLVITPELGQSRIVRQLEAPRLIAIHASQREFALGLVNAVTRAGGGIDYEAPDHLLETRPGTLSGVDQKPTDRQGLHALVRSLLWHRIAQQRPLVAANAGTFTISVQTRNTPQVFDRTDSQLDIRVRPATHGRLPSAEGLEDLKDTIGLLPDAVTRSAAKRVVVRGGAHLSVAFALGAALPSTRIGQLQVVDQEGVSWLSGSGAPTGLNPHLTIQAEGRTAATGQGGPEVAVYIDLTPQRSQGAFDRFLAENASLVAWRHIVAGTGKSLDPTDAGVIAAEIAAHLREVSYDNDNVRVHVLLHCPFPIAVLTGRLTNTLSAVVYEWDDSGPTPGVHFRPRYVPTLVTRASAPDGAIQQVMIT